MRRRRSRPVVAPEPHPAPPARPSLPDDVLVLGHPGIRSMTYVRPATSISPLKIPTGCTKWLRSTFTSRCSLCGANGSKRNLTVPSTVVIRQGFMTSAWSNSNRVRASSGARATVDPHDVLPRPLTDPGEALGQVEAEDGAVGQPTGPVGPPPRGVPGHEPLGVVVPAEAAVEGEGPGALVGVHHDLTGDGQPGGLPRDRDRRLVAVLHLRDRRDPDARLDAGSGRPRSTAATGRAARRSIDPRTRCNRVVSPSRRTAYRVPGRR